MNSDRYSRQIMMPEFGDDGQEKLTDASILVIGAGGLGTTLLYHLAAAGIGTIGIADHDIVSISNLNRQFIYFEEDAGSLKVNSAAKKLRAFNSEINIIPHATAINKDNAYEIISQYDIVALAVDNAQARMIVNDACVDLNKPFVDGGINGFVGTTAFVDPHHTPCLACLYGTDLPPEERFSAISSVVGTIASIEATSVIQYLLDLDIPLAGHLLYYDAKSAEFEKLPMKFKEDCPICGGKKNKHK
ncbi:MAG: HesA/MoeB/ThiF family protein [Ruminococcaceae bacterium]|nr:HesA/MoeB/ThiF family protein [Oscillospiraceae bacterium]